MRDLHLLHMNNIQDHLDEHVGIDYWQYPGRPAPTPSSTPPPSLTAFLQLKWPVPHLATMRQAVTFFTKNKKKIVADLAKVKVVIMGKAPTELKIADIRRLCFPPSPSSPPPPSAPLLPPSPTNAQASMMRSERLNCSSTDSPFNRPRLHPRLLNRRRCLAWNEGRRQRGRQRVERLGRCSLGVSHLDRLCPREGRMVLIESHVLTVLVSGGAG